MNPPRSNVLDADNFQNSEVQIAVGALDHFTAGWMKSIFNGLILYSLFKKRKTTSGMDLQNISRTTIYRKLVLVVLLLTSAVKIPQVQSWIGEYKDRLDSVNKMSDALRLICLLLFISGRLREADPFLNAIGSVPIVSDPTRQRVVSVDLVTRFLTFQSISSIVLLIAPWVDIRRLISLLVRKISSPAPLSCVACNTASIVLPQVAKPCGHIYCYYCISSEDVSFSCFRCFQPVASFSHLV